MRRVAGAQKRETPLKPALREGGNARRCIHNELILCPVKDCMSCGWDPDVQRMRKAEIRKRRRRDAILSMPKMWRES